MLNKCEHNTLTGIHFKGNVKVRNSWKHSACVWMSRLVAHVDDVVRYQNVKCCKACKPGI